MKEYYERGELAKQILMLCVVGGAVASIAVLPGLAYVLDALEGRGSRQKDRVRQAVRSMERNGLLMRKIKNGREEFVVTPKGKQRLAVHLLEDMRIERPKKWDGKWRALMFDIPEARRKGGVRREVSFLLKDIGMEAIQNSVFISPFPCKKEIDRIARFYDVEAHFIYFETDNIECRQDLLTTFRLSR